jgi:hypothetical protein
MIKQKVRISEPCHMTWREMDKIENSTSRHCKECSIDLVDFTSMSDEEMISYLSARKTEKVCVKMYAADALSDASKVQVILLDWYRKTNSSLINRHLKAVILVIIGSVLLTACGGGDYDIPPCKTRSILMPDTTTIDPTDSIEVILCD